ncbi:MAG: conjugal transfer protein [Acidimicrobiia bacterium]
MTAGTVGDVLAAEDRRRRVNPTIAIRALQALLWLLVVSGPAAALVLASHFSALNGRLEAVESAAAAADPSVGSSGAAGFAELFMAAYLDADEGSTIGLDRFVDGFALDGVEAGHWSVVRTTSLGGTEIAPGYFAVTVAVELIAQAADSDSTSVPEQVGMLFYSVGVAETDSGWTVAGLPSLMPAPSRVSAPDLLVDRLDGIDDPGLEDMVGRFLSAYLTGDSELARYMAPSSPALPVHPPPFIAVEVLRTGMAEDKQGGTVVAVVARATGDAGRAQLLEFWLAVSQRDGRWEVAEVLSAPPLADASDD